jgi:nucleotide-binding universal stress UspA family protein
VCDTSTTPISADAVSYDMPREILVPTDGSPLGRDAVEYVVETFPDGVLRLLYVIDPRYTGPDDDELHPERVFADLRDVADEREVPVKTETRVGHPGREIVEYSEEHAIDEIAMGSHGRERTARILYGSVAENVVRRAPVPVTVVRPHQRSGTLHVLVAIDASEQSQKALEYALAVFPESELTVFHAIEPRETHYGEGQEIHSDASYDQIEAEAAELLVGARETANEHGVEAETTMGVEWGPNEQADAILDYVGANDVDHVVLGSHGRSGVSRILLGSVAEKVARRSPAPVTIVR